jgi:Flp pilus assembly protein TadG
MKHPSSEENRVTKPGALELRPRGQSMLELAMALPFLLILFLVSADFGRVFYLGIEVGNAARAGAQYASQSVATAVDTAGIKNAAAVDAANLSNLSVSSSNCTCVSPIPSGQTACASSYCTNSPNANYVQVDASATFKTLVKYPGVPSSVTVPGRAIVQVQQ